ncbi:interleukin 15, like isoform X2 [Sebastes umbrosus]|uniref:interleukin 15, like isoform X2 n=1 Tax=Sebastes umbrosus TaxID=72105 RepID=UPI00189C73E5|nr:interleukin 15, like isoform X2 [Sebastes umbrosus]
MLRGWLALASVYLCLSCLLGVTSPKPPGCTKPLLLEKVNGFIEIANNTSFNCSLYTPSNEDVKKCPRSSLQCFAAEVEVLFVEWHINNVPGADKFRLHKKLEGEADLIKPTTESGCRHCEVFEMKQPLMFLEDLQRTLQWMNARYCDPTPRKLLSKHPFSSS